MYSLYGMDYIFLIMDMYMKGQTLEYCTQTYKMNLVLIMNLQSQCIVIQSSSCTNICKLVALLLRKQLFGIHTSQLMKIKNALKIYFKNIFIIISFY